MKLVPLGEDVSWAKQEGPADPHNTLLQHFQVNDLPNQGSLFTYQAKNGHWLLTRQKFLKSIEIALKKAGLQPLKDHGICISSTLEYLLRNMPFDIIKVKGC